jgi:hypothetical protein
VQAQSHGEKTGHSDFGESTEAIKIMKCAACGKACQLSSVSSTGVDAA